MQRELRTIGECEDWLTAHLTGEEKKRFLDFADAWSVYNGDATLDGFITGFRLGARFVLDAFVLPDASPQNYREEDASPEIREWKREVESKKAVLQKRRALFPKL